MISEITIKITLGPEATTTVSVPATGATLETEAVPPPPEVPDDHAGTTGIVPPVPEALEDAGWLTVDVPPPPQIDTGVTEMGVSIAPPPELADRAGEDDTLVPPVPDADNESFAVPAPELKGPPSATSDDLERIDGIGPRIAQLLHEAGILSFDQLAATEINALDQLLTQADLARINPGSWPEQAARLAEATADG